MSKIEMALKLMSWPLHQQVDLSVWCSLYVAAIVLPLCLTSVPCSKHAKYFGPKRAIIQFVAVRHSCKTLASVFAATRNGQHMVQGGRSCNWFYFIRIGSSGASVHSKHGNERQSFVQSEESLAYLIYSQRPHQDFSTWRGTRGEERYEFRIGKGL